ncbi:MAG: hypothetical protein P1Q69_16300 [Candidatus Thorarchaeota archaeon]|nr:hypothetical protein [Candidatus Thorarchaeota archaeon]
MDFTEALNMAGQVIVIILFSNLMIYFTRIREITADITPGTKRALYSYGFAGFGMIAASVVSITPEYRFLMMSAGAIVLGFIMYAEMYILYEKKKASIGGNVTLLLMVLSLAGTLAGEFINPVFDILNMASLTILLIGSLVFTVALLRENPTTFSISLFAVLISYLATWVIGIVGWTFANPEYFIIQILPLIVAAAIFGSVRRPWRRTLALLIMLTNFSVLTPLILTSFYSGEVLIWGVLAVGMIAGLALLAPLDYFVLQATKTGSLTSRYLAIVVSFIALLVISHGLSWAVYQTNGVIPNVSWDPYMIWFDAVIGSVAIIAFILAPRPSLFGDWTYSTSREIMIVYGTIISLLAFPLVQGVVIIIGFIMYFVIGYRLYKAGAGRAARNLLVFVVAAIIIALATMYSDEIPLYMVISSLIIGAILALLSSPPVIVMLSRTLRRRSQPLEKEPLQETTSNY